MMDMMLVCGGGEGVGYGAVDRRANVVGAFTLFHQGEVFSEWAY